MNKPLQYSVLNKYIFFAIWMKNSFNITEEEGKNLIDVFDNSELATSKEVLSLIDIVASKYEEHIKGIVDGTVKPRSVVQSLNHNFLDQIHDLSLEIDSKNDEILELKTRIKALEKT